MKVFFDHPSRQISTTFSLVLAPGWNDVPEVVSAEMIRVGLVTSLAPDGSAAPDVAPLATPRLLEAPGPALTAEELKAVDDSARETKRGSRRER